MDEQPGPEHGTWTDGWDGYPLARQRLMGDMQSAQLRNPVIAGGDLHCNVVAAVPGDPERFASAPVASEFCGTSLSAEARPQSYSSERHADNAHIHQLRSDQRGYTLLEFGRERLSATLQVVKDVHVQQAQFEVQARYVVESGKAGVKPA